MTVNNIDQTNIDLNSFKKRELQFSLKENKAFKLSFKSVELSN